MSKLSLNEKIELCRPGIELEKKILELEDEIQRLNTNLRTCATDYWFMTYQLENYNDPKEAMQECVKRMKFRKPLFKGIV